VNHVTTIEAGELCPHKESISSLLSNVDTRKQWAKNHIFHCLFASLNYNSLNYNKDKGPTARRAAGPPTKPRNAGLFRTLKTAVGFAV
jgi:hypothetical protein